MILGFLLILALFFGLGALMGAPYLPILRRDQASLLELCELKPGQTLLDLGSGDGRLLRLAASRGIRGIGYEINPLVYLVSLVVCWPYRRLIKLHLADFWQVRLPEADVIYVFLIDRYMAKLDRKLIAELKRPTPVVSFVFKIPGREPVKSTRNAARYEYPASALMTK